MDWLFFTHRSCLLFLQVVYLCVCVCESVSTYMVPLCVPVCTCSNKILFSCRVSAWVGLRGCYIVTERLCCQCPSLSSRFYLIVLHCASLLSQLILQPSSDGQIEKSLWYILFFTSNFHCCPVECQIEGVVGEWLKNAGQRLSNGVSPAPLLVASKWLDSFE